MSKGINKAILLGNIGNEPELRHLPNGTAVTTINIATSESWKDKTGEKQEKTEWHRVVLFKRLAEFAAQYIKKGSKVYVEGKIQTRKWKDKVTGQEKTITEILAHDLQMISNVSTQTTQKLPQTVLPEPETGFTEDDIPF